MHGNRQGRPTRRPEVFKSLQRKAPGFQDRSKTCFSQPSCFAGSSLSLCCAARPLPSSLPPLAACPSGSARMRSPVHVGTHRLCPKWSSTCGPSRGARIASPRQFRHPSYGSRVRGSSTDGPRAVARVASPPMSAHPSHGSCSRENSTSAPAGVRAGAGHIPMLNLRSRLSVACGPMPASMLAVLQLRIELSPQRWPHSMPGLALPPRRWSH